MTGTEKQIKWAEQIRAEFMAKIEAGKETFMAKAGVNQAPEAIKADIMAAYDRLINWQFASPSNWIDDRNALAGAIMLDAKTKDAGVYKVAAMLSKLQII